MLSGLLALVPSQWPKVTWMATGRPLLSHRCAVIEPPKSLKDEVADAYYFRRYKP